MPGLDGILNQAFSNVVPTADSFSKGYQDASQQLDYLTKVSAQLDEHKATLQLNQQKLADENLTRSNELLVKAGGKDVPPSMRKFLLEGASNLRQRGGAGPLSDAFIQAYNADPQKIAQGLSLAMDVGGLATIREKRDQLVNSAATAGAPEDVAYHLERMFDAVKPMLGPAGQVLQQGAKVTNAVSEKLAEQRLNNINTLMKSPYTPEGALATQLPVRGKDGIPLTVSDYAKNVMAAKGEVIGDDQASRLGGAAFDSTLQKTMMQEAAYRAQGEKMSKLQSEINDKSTDLSGLSAKDKKIAQDFAAGFTPDTKGVDTWKKAYDKIAGTLGTATANLKFTREMQDKFDSVVTSNRAIQEKGSDAFKEIQLSTDRLIPLLQKAAKGLDVPLSMLRPQLTAFTKATDTAQRVAQPEINRVLFTTEFQKGMEYLGSILNQSDTAKLTPAQAQALLVSAQAARTAKSAVSLNSFYHSADSMHDYSSNIQPLVEKYNQRVEKEAMPFMLSPAPSEKLKNYLLNQAKSKGKSLDQMVDQAIMTGVNPWAIKKFLIQKGVK